MTPTSPPGSETVARHQGRVGNSGDPLGSSQPGGRVAQLVNGQETPRPSGSRMSPYERRRGVTPAEQREAQAVADATETPATRRGGVPAVTGGESIARGGERLPEEACAGNPLAGFCEGEADNRAGSNIVTLPIPKGGSNREHKADLSPGAVLPTRQFGPLIQGNVVYIRHKRSIKVW